jgi:hypothetical protein
LGELSVLGVLFVFVLVLEGSEKKKEGARERMDGARLALEDRDKLRHHDVFSLELYLFHKPGLAAARRDD